MELRHVRNRQTARKFRGVVKEHQKTIKQLKTQLQFSQAADSVRNENNQYTAGMHVFVFYNYKQTYIVFDIQISILLPCICVI